MTRGSLVALLPPDTPDDGLCRPGSRPLRRRWRQALSRPAASLSPATTPGAGSPRSPSSPRAPGPRPLATNDVPLPPPRPPAAAGRGHLHPRACTDRRGGALAVRQRRAPPQAARARWRGCSADHPQALESTLEIVERCRFSLDELAYDYPVAGLPTTAARPTRSWSGGPGRAPRERYPGPSAGEGRAAAPARARADRASSATRPTSSPSTTSSLTPAAGTSSARAAARPPTRPSATCLGVTAVDPVARRPAVRALRLGRARRAARHRRRFRARAARGGDPVDLRHLRPRPCRARRHRDPLPRQVGDARGRQGHGPHRRRAGRAQPHRLGLWPRGADRARPARGRARPRRPDLAPDPRRWPRS